MDPDSAQELSCPVCRDIFKNPFILSCCHSICKECLHQSWKAKKARMCPVCRRKSSKEETRCNLALRNLCDSIRKVQSSSESEEICSLHDAKLKLFCLEDKQTVCLVCRDSEKHVNHTFRPIREAVSSHKEEFNKALTSVQNKLKHAEEIKEECDKAVRHIKTQTGNTGRQIKQQFEKLHQFLRDEEEASLTALREEEEQKSQMMKEKLEEMNRHISALSHTVTDMEEMMKANDVCFLKNFNPMMARSQIPEPEFQMSSGALINVPHHLRNLPFRVWKKMKEIIQYTPLTLDPNTAHPCLTVSSDLTSVSFSGYQQEFPDSPERFDYYLFVLSSEGFNSGSHCYDVEVGDNTDWAFGVTTESNQRKGNIFFDSAVWSVGFYNCKYWSFSPEQHETAFTVEEDVERVRVQLDYDRGTVSFYNSVTHTHLKTFTTTFTESVFLFLYNRCSSSPLRISPDQLIITREQMLFEDYRTSKTYKSYMSCLSKHVSTLLGCDLSLRCASKV